MFAASDEYYMQMALAQAQQAAACGEVPVGAVLVLGDGQVFTAHNAPISKHDATAHAEIRVIRQACEAVGNYRLVGAQLFVSLEPCLMCAGAMIHARIQRLVYAAHEPKTGAVDSLYLVLSDERLNHQVQVEHGLLAEEAADKMRFFFRNRRKKCG